MNERSKNPVNPVNPVILSLSCPPVDKPTQMRRTILLMATLFYFFQPASAQQKRVLLEKYTSAFCGACPNAHLIAEDTV